MYEPWTATLFRFPANVSATTIKPTSTPSEVGLIIVAEKLSVVFYPALGL